FMMRKPSIPRRNRVNWHYVRDDVLFSTIMVAYKEYYACATGEAAPKPKASARKKKSGSALSTTPPTPISTPTPTTTVVAAPSLSTTAKDEGTGSRPGVLDVPSDDSEEALSWNSFDDEDVDEKTKGREESEGYKTDESDDDNDDDDDEEETIKIGEQEVKESDEGDDEATESNRESKDEESREHKEESFDPIPRTPEDNDDDDNNEEDQGLRIGEEERMQEEEDSEELCHDVDINQGWGLQVSQETEDSHVWSRFLQLVQLPVKSLKDNFSNIPGIVNQYMHQQMPEATNQLQDSIQRENDEFLKTIDENMKKIIKEQVKSQVKAQVTRILPRIEEAVNAQLEAEVLTRSSHSLRTSYAVAADLSEMELKKILIDKMEGNKSIQRSDEQRNLYKALVEAYDADKTILDIYGESTILNQRREDDDQEGPSTGSDWGRSTIGSQSRQLSASEFAFAEEPVQTTCQMEEPLHPVFKTGAEDQPIIQTTQHPKWFSQPRRPPTPDRNWNKFVPAAPGNAQSWISALSKQTDARSSFNELLDTPIDFSNFIMNRLDVDTLTPELLAGPTYELMRALCNSLTELEYHLEEVYKATTDYVIPFEHFINNDLEYLRGGASSRKYTTSVTKTKAADYRHIKWIEDLVPRAMWIHEPMSYDKHALWGVSHWGQKRQQFYRFAVNRESALDVYSKRRIIAVTELKIVEWHNYKHLDWISVRRDDDKIYKFKEGDLKRLRIQDIEDMLLLLVQGKLSNLTVEERFAFNVSLRMLMRSIVIQRRVEDLQLGVESYQKRLNLTKPDTYRDGTLNDVRNALDDRLKGIQIQYLPTTIWRRGDKARAATMIQAIDKMLKTRRIMRSLERFVGGRQYEGDFRMLQSTI
nr:hypothetical protein [Tanacetum cinerariifolium]